MPERGILLQIVPYHAQYRDAIIALILDIQNNEAKNRLVASGAAGFARHFRLLSGIRR